MPAMDGYQFIADLRRLPRTAMVPAIALTGFGRTQDAVRALSSGFNAHIGKPVSLQTLLGTIRSLLRFPNSTEF
jgi:two-component system CheB/CheR fusion protein